MSFRQNSLFVAAAVATALGFISPGPHAQQGPGATQSAAPPAPQTQAAAASQAGAAPAFGPEFVYDVASIKPSQPFKPGVRVVYGYNLMPDGLTVNSVTARSLVMAAYGIDKNQLSDADTPDWFRSETYDVQAKMDPAVADELKKMPPDQGQLARARMLQRLLAERFGVKTHRETKQLAIYLLEAGKNGPKLTPHVEASPPPPGSADAPDATGAKGSKATPPGPLFGPDRKIQLPKGASAVMMVGGGQNGLAMSDQPISLLAAQLSRLLGREVVDKTGLTGKYDFRLQWTSGVHTSMPNAATAGASPAAAGPAPAADADSGPTIFAAIQEQLGLKLESAKGPVEIIVVDHVERPSEN